MKTIENRVRHTWVNLLRSAHRAPCFGRGTKAHSGKTTIVSEVNANCKTSRLKYFADESCQPVIIGSLILWESINSLSTWLKESGIKPGQFSVVTASKSINRMRAPELFEMNKHFINNRTIVKINNLTEKNVHENFDRVVSSSYLAEFGCRRWNEKCPKQCLAIL